MKAIRIRNLFGLMLLVSPAVAVPPTPQPDPSGILKNRYNSMSIPDTGGNPVAIRVTLASLMSTRADPPSGRMYVLEGRAGE